MREVNGEELKQLQLGILDCLADFCEKRNVKYWLDFGTLLGAVRHKGYIPWDDDIDVGMLREDYIKLSKEFNSFSDRYRFVNIEMDSNTRYAFGKIIDEKTRLYEPDIYGIKFYVNIDIWIYDNVPDDAQIINKMIRKSDFYNKLNVLKYIGLKNSMRNRGLLKTCILILGKCVLFPFPSNYFVKCIDENAKRYHYVQTGVVGDFYGPTLSTIPRSMFDNLIDLQFEEKKYKAPSRYDEWLMKLYGDYMQLPPIEQRVTHHEFQAFLDE